jgi:hypothetical protein
MVSPLTVEVQEWEYRHCVIILDHNHLALSLPFG